MDELFSVIVANYNNGQYLPFLVDSLKKQTYNNWELLIADDASTDDSVDYIKKIVSEDSRIKWTQHEINRGAGATFKSAMDISSGGIIGMLGADDALEEDTLAIMADAHKKHPTGAVISSRAYDCDEHMQKTGLCEISGQQPDGVSFLHDIKVSNFITFKRSMYIKTTGFDAEQQRAVDHDLLLKLEEVGDVVFVDKPLYLYRRHAMGISQGGNGLKAANFGLLAKMKAYERRRASNFKPNYSKAEYNDIAWLYYKRIAYQFSMQPNFSEAVASNIKTIYFKPSYVFDRSFWSVFYRSLKGQTA